MELQGKIVCECCLRELTKEDCVCSQTVASVCAALGATPDDVVERAGEIVVAVEILKEDGRATSDVMRAAGFEACEGGCGWFWRRDMAQDSEGVWMCPECAKECADETRGEG